MFKIIGRLLGIEKDELKYDKELLIFTFIGAMIFILVGISHTEKGAEFIYENKLNRAILVTIEKEGVTKEYIDKKVNEYKETVPINVSEYDLEDIKNNVKVFIESLNKENSTYLSEVILKLEEANKSNSKEHLINNLKEINIKEMLVNYSKGQIVAKNLKEIKEWQTNIFLSNVYIICGGFMMLSFIIVKVICEINIIDKNEENIES